MTHWPVYGSLGVKRLNAHTSWSSQYQATYSFCRSLPLPLDDTFLITSVLPPCSGVLEPSLLFTGTTRLPFHGTEDDFHRPLQHLWPLFQPTTNSKILHPSLLLHFGCLLHFSLPFLYWLSSIWELVQIVSFHSMSCVRKREETLKYWLRWKRKGRTKWTEGIDLQVYKNEFLILRHDPFIFFHSLLLALLPEIWYSVPTS